MPSEANRFQRQEDLVPRDRLADIKATVIGVGAIGRQVCLQLAAIGVPRLADRRFRRGGPDQRHHPGLLGQRRGPTQGRGHGGGHPAARSGHRRGMPSKTATGRGWKSARPSSAAWTPSTPAAAIWRSAGSRCRFWCDGRMLGEVLRVLAVADDIGRDHYPTTLFAQSEAQPGRCTARSTIYAASIAAGLMVHQFTRWLRGMPVDRDTTLNLLAGEWSVV